MQPDEPLLYSAGEKDVILLPTAEHCNNETALRQIPHVDKLMKNKIITDSGIYRHEAADAVRETLAELRDKLKKGETDKVPGEDVLAQKAVSLAQKHERKNIIRVINATGVILHSNLGRACLSAAAAKAAMEAAGAYCTLEYDLETGARGSRTGCIEERLQAVTGCEASLIVNNNAAAVLLILSGLARGGNVIVSRGELVEIGGGFRIPEIITQCGCQLREVGTTNKTRLADYAGAIDADTRALLKIHTSNYKLIGFTESVTVKELSGLAKSKGLTLIEDIGSGALTDLMRYGINDEPLAATSLEDGADIVSFSGDKLLGGPQCGVILGREKLIKALKTHPLYRALRADKMTIAAMEATLRIYADQPLAEREIPVLSMLSLTADELRSRAEKLRDKISQCGGSAEVVQAKSAAGSGSVPGLELDSYAIAPVSEKSASRIERELRELPVPIIGHIEKDRLLLDVRTIFESDYDYIADSLARITP